MADVDAFATATSLLSALRTGGVSATELTELYIRRIERHDGRLNAVVVRDFDRARQQARAADQSRARNESAPLLGLPITLKESINVTGLHTTCGVPEWQGYISQHDAPVTTRTRAAAAVNRRTPVRSAGRKPGRRAIRRCGHPGSHDGARTLAYCKGRFAWSRGFL